MLLDSDAESDVAYELCQVVGRAILPYRSSDDDQHHGTAFFFQGGDDPVGESLLTAADLVGTPGGELGLRTSVTEPAGVAPAAVSEVDIVPGWARFPGDGVAVLPTAGLHRLAGDGGWRWRVQPVPAGIAAGPEVVARLGADAGSAFVLAHGVREDGSRPLEVAIERVVRDGDAVRITTELPQGYVGAPVFVVQLDSSGELSPYCLGLVLPGVGEHPVATFDRIRAVLPATPGDI
ncbi:MULTISPECIES: hypothetical protein [Micromonospora]|uniref:hypothetical protein n=1 Tax=Micromonospora TaxID=1873 RepID=UPI001B38A396|nr:hypothetical protein [Micromonospora sp. M61]MBQ0977747.1 hypothetical protein [Micromonospora sp. M61]WTI21492.1 hypothetical protein OG886_32240 [Micromonospora zamorensis]